MKRSRGRNRRQGNPANRNYESNGPDVRVRGHASTIYEKYLSLARDALTAGNPVNAENYFQHAEHYFRIMSVNQPVKTDEGSEQENADGDLADGNVEPLVLGKADENGQDETENTKGRRRGHLRRRPKDESPENTNNIDASDNGESADNEDALGDPSQDSSSIAAKIPAESSSTGS